MAIKKIIDITLTREEIESLEEIVIEVGVHSEEDPDNEEGVTYTITYPKK